MNILVVDRDRQSSGLLSSVLEKTGASVTVQPSRKEAVEQVEKDRYDIIFVDPSPMREPRPVVLALRHAADRYYPYIFWIGREVDAESAVLKGINNVAAKPLQPDDLREKIEHAERLVNLTERLSNNRDYPVNGGIMPKSFFRQLYFSSIERANRYGEKSYMIFFRLAGEDPGDQIRDDILAHMMELFNKLRRHSDFMGRTGPNEFALLIQRPLTEQEPVDAAGRYMAELENLAEDENLRDHAPEFSSEIVYIPGGNLIHQS